MEHGEALYYGNEKYGNEYLKKELKGLKGVIAVSNQNKHYVVDSGIVDERITTVYPNCFREERFHYIDKEIAREHFGWDKDLFIVGYAGSFDERKGKRAHLLFCVATVILAYYLAFPKKRLEKTFKLVIAGAFVAFGLAIFSEYVPQINSVFERFQTAGTDKESLGRFIMWKYAFNIFEQKPLLGTPLTRCGV